MTQYNSISRQRVFSFSGSGTTDVMPALQIQYCGSKLYASVTVATDVVTLKADDTDGLTTTVGTFDTTNASYNTYLELRNAINALGSFRCFLIGQLPDRVITTNGGLEDKSVTQLKKGASKTIQNRGLTLFTEAAAEFTCGFAITNQCFSGQPAGDLQTQQQGWQKDAGCQNKLWYLDLNVTAVGNGTTKIYSVNDEDDTYTLIYSDAFTTATGETKGNTSSLAPFLQGNLGHRLLVQFVGAAACTAQTITGWGVTEAFTAAATPLDGAYTGCV